MASEKTRLPIPRGWVAAPLRQAIQPRGEKAAPSDHPDARFIGMDHVESHSTRILGSLPASTMTSTAASFCAGDVLYGRLRPYLNKVAQPNFDGLASAEFIVFPNTMLISSRFLKHRLNTVDFVSYASHLNEGDRPRVSFDQIGEFEVLIPPPLEQDRIVAKIEELFSELDKGVENLKTAHTQLNVYRQAVLKHAFEGKLTAQWREENKDKLETPEQLLARIKQVLTARQEQQLAKWKKTIGEWEANGKPGKRPSKPKKARKLPPLTEAELAKLPDLPKGWVWCRFGLLDIELRRGPFGSSIIKSMFVPSGFKVYEQGNAIYRDAARGSYFINEEKYEELSGFAVSPGDFVVSCAGTVGRIYELPENTAAGVINQALMRVRINDTILSKLFFAKLFESAVFQRKVHSDAKGTAMVNLAGIKELNLVPVAICSLSEQKAIEELLDARLSEVDQCDRTIGTSFQQAEALRQSILRKAFAGQLVLQDPRDEPASVLLDRIRAVREKTVQNNPSKKTKMRKTTV